MVLGYWRGVAELKIERVTAATYFTVVAERQLEEVLHNFLVLGVEDLGASVQQSQLE